MLLLNAPASWKTSAVFVQRMVVLYFVNNILFKAWLAAW